MIAVLFLLTGCMAVYQPIPEGYSGEIATITDSFANKGNSKADYFMLTQIDGNTIESSWGATRSRNYGGGFAFTPAIISRDVPTQNLTLTLTGMVFFPTDAQAMFGKTLKVEGTFSFSPEANEVYTVNGELSKDASKVWLEDSSGTVVSKVFEEIH